MSSSSTSSSSSIKSSSSSTSSSSFRSSSIVSSVASSSAASSSSSSSSSSTLPISVNYCNVSDVNPSAGQNITLWSNVTAGHYAVDDVWFIMEAYTPYSYMDGTLYADEWNMINNDSTVWMQCCANDTQNNVECRNGPVVYLTNSCYKYLYTGEIIKAVLCVFENAFEFGGEV